MSRYTSERLRYETYHVKDKRILTSSSAAAKGIILVPKALAANVVMDARARTETFILMMIVEKVASVALLNIVLLESTSI